MGGKSPHKNCFPIGKLIKHVSGDWCVSGRQHPSHPNKQLPLIKKKPKKHSGSETSTGFEI